MRMKVAIWPDFFPVSFLISVVPSSLEFVAISKGKDKGILQCYINYQTSVSASNPKKYWYFNTTRIYKQQQQSNKSLGKKGQLCSVNYPLKNTLKRRITPCRCQCSDLSLRFLQGGPSLVPGPQVVGTSEKKIKRKRTGQDFLLFSLFHFLRAQFSFLSFIFSALGFLFTCSD